MSRAVPVPAGPDPGSTGDSGSRTPGPSPGAGRTRRLVRPLAAAVVGWGLALLLRHAVVEPTPIIHACDLAPWQGWCAPRSALILLFSTQALGWLALAAGALATFTRSLAWATLALASGAAGLVLYCVEPSAAGALAGALVFARPPAQP